MLRKTINARAPHAPVFNEDQPMSFKFGNVTLYLAYRRSQLCRDLILSGPAFIILSRKARQARIAALCPQGDFFPFKQPVRLHAPLKQPVWTDEFYLRRVSHWRASISEFG